MKRRISELLQRLTGTRPRALSLQIQPLHGGLGSASVRAVTARYQGDGRGPPQIQHWVVKQLRGRARREATIYQALERSPVSGIAPAVVAIEVIAARGLQLYLEPIVPSHPWPWKDPAAATSVLHALACLHDSVSHELAVSVSDWDYELELQQRAVRLLRELEVHRSTLRAAGLDVRLPVIRRITLRLPEWRRHLLSQQPFGRSIIHGDAHPGNIRMTHRAGESLPKIFDWERARLGSPLEDVSSWLQTLAFWEPEARRRHDTLLGSYLLARGSSPRPTRALRDMYWLAAASNCLSGSLLYHLELGTSRSSLPPARRAALAAVGDQLRILRRADACWS